MTTKHHLTPNKYSRPQRPVKRVRAIVLHYGEWPGGTARQYRDDWEDKKHGTRGYGSAHLIVDDRETIEAIPLNEMAYHVGADSYTTFALEFLGSYPNATTIGVEMCHPTKSGEYTIDTWQRAVRVVSALLIQHSLGPHNITTHHAITGKYCPKWFVDHPDELERFRWDVALHMKRGSWNE
jgi:N-acetylmuramoyl-L-alanine amidase CwlA